jgi:hypothetical protein
MKMTDCFVSVFAVEVKALGIDSILGLVVNRTSSAIPGIELGASVPQPLTLFTELSPLLLLPDEQKLLIRISWVLTMVYNTGTRIVIFVHRQES